jgi:indole-3-glycerol phosphate synthase
MSSILEKIVEQSRIDLQKRRQKTSMRDFESFEGFEKKRIDFAKALSKSAEVAIIAEVKKASPSKGVIREDFNPLHIALGYEDAGAAAISVLTDEPFFQGSLNYLSTISGRVQIPCLRKDFIFDPYQIAEARAYGADAVLLIATICSKKQLSELQHAAEEYGLQTLTECYSEEDFEKVDFKSTPVLGVNNRDLNTFEVDVHRGIELLNRAPKGVIKVSESGLNTDEDLFTLHQSGIHAALIGESLMRKEKPGEALKELRKGLRTLIEKSESHV